mgnify:CR=1 FL=1
MTDKGIYKLMNATIDISLYDLFRLPELHDLTSSHTISKNKDIRKNRKEAVYFFNESIMFKELGVSYKWLKENYFRDNLEKMIENYLLLTIAYDKLYRDFIDICKRNVRQEELLHRIKDVIGEKLYKTIKKECRKNIKIE